MALLLVFFGIPLFCYTTGVSIAVWQAFYEYRQQGLLKTSWFYNRSWLYTAVDIVLCLAVSGYMCSGFYSFIIKGSLWDHGFVVTVIFMIITIITALSFIPMLYLKIKTSYSSK